MSGIPSSDSAAAVWHRLRRARMTAVADAARPRCEAAGCGRPCKREFFQIGGGVFVNACCQTCFERVRAALPRPCA